MTAPPKQDLGSDSKTLLARATHRGRDAKQGNETPGPHPKPARRIVPEWQVLRDALALEARCLSREKGTHRHQCRNTLARYDHGSASLSACLPLPRINRHPFLPARSE